MHCLQWALTLTFLTALCVLLSGGLSNLAAQDASLQVVNGTSGVALNSTQGGLCNNNGNPRAVCANQKWNYQGDPIISGYGSGSASDAYGVLQATLIVYVQCGIPCSGFFTSGTSGSAVNDVFNFEGLTGNGPYFLKGIVKVDGHINGGFAGPPSNAIAEGVTTLQDLTSPAYSTCSAMLNSNGPSTGIVQLACNTQIQIFASDTVNVLQAFSVEAGAELNSDTSPVNQLIECNFTNDVVPAGARFSYVIVDADGQQVKGAKIITRSGHTYPTH